ncbi:hypothetical protein Tco_0063179, partial [Tanacetum coccineum]
MDVTDAAIRALIARGMADALAKQEIQRNTNLNGDGSQGSGNGITRPVRPTRECTYNDFHKCQLLNFKDTEGVVGLTYWFERMETVFHISNCTIDNQVKFATFTLLGVALTWTKTMQEAIELVNDLMDQKLKLTPLGLVKGKSMLELFHYATSTSFIIMARALQSAQTARKSAILQGIAGILLLLSIKGPPLAMNVEIKGTTRVIA